MSITIEAAQALAELAALRARLAAPEPVLALIGAAAAQRARERIQATKRGPDGQSWAPWAPRTRAARTARGTAARGLLWDSGALLNSIEVQTSAVDVVIGTPIQYAEGLQDGTPKMPARAFLGWTDADMVQGEQLMVAYLGAGL